MIQVTEKISLDEGEIQEEFIRASGPGGQNVNKVSTAVRLRFNAKESPSLTNDVRDRLLKQAGNKMTEEGILIIEAKRFRTQNQNRIDALKRLIHLITKATEKPKPRRKTKPTKSSQKKRLETKKHRSQTKNMRKSVSDTNL